MLKHLPIDRQHLLSPLLLIVAAFICSVPFAHNIDTFNFQHEAVNQGQWYRLMTHAFWHTNTNHFLLNSAGILLVWALHGEYYNQRNVLGVIGFGILLSGCLVWCFSPDIDRYVGLSAALHGLFVWGACHDICKHRRSGWLLLIGLCSKLIQEQWFEDPTTAELINATVATMAHVYGAFAGGCYFVIEKIWSRHAHRNQISKP